MLKNIIPAHLFYIVLFNRILLNNACLACKFYNFGNISEGK